MKSINNYIIEKFKLGSKTIHHNEKIKQLIGQIHQVLCTKKPNSDKCYSDDYAQLIGIKDGPFEDIYQKYGDAKFNIMTSLLSVTSEDTEYIYNKLLTVMEKLNWKDKDMIDLLYDIKDILQKNNIQIGA